MTTSSFATHQTDTNFSFQAFVNTFLKAQLRGQKKLSSPQGQPPAFEKTSGAVASTPPAFLALESLLCAPVFYLLRKYRDQEGRERLGKSTTGRADAGKTFD